ncbi:MAG TPA: hypothetical protein VGC89_11800 [Pyrinomonadaceae bacterium]
MMKASTRTALNWADDETLRAVRPEVRVILESSQAFAQLSPEEQRQLAGTMVKVASYMVNPDGLAAKELSHTEPVLARAQADGVEAVKDRLAKDPGFAGKDFKGGAIKESVKQFGELVKKVDFSNFVSGLIKNVFQAIVDSSIQQMKAYGELLANVAKTVDQFAQDNISPNNARDWLAQKFPGKLGIETPEMSGGFAEGDTPPPAAPKVVVTAEDMAAALKAVSEEMQLPKPITDISDEKQEAELVRQAQLQIARGRQQLLASMVMLGINRIVVTDGLIHAKVVFDMRASDGAGRKSKASMYDREEDAAYVNTHAEYSSWLSPFSASVDAGYNQDHVATVESSVEETSESKAALKANLTGEVRVNFKSDYFPMEKLANPQMIAAIQGNAKPPDKPITGA